LAAARERGDTRAETAALTDLGIMSLSEGDAKGGLARLEEALTLARRLGDRTAAADILGHIGLAHLQLDQPQRARQLFERDLAQAQQAGDRVEQKAALERLGVVHARLGDPARARAFFELALGLARKLGDRQHQADLLWHLAIQHAELGERVMAACKAEAAVALLEQLGKPPASVLRTQLDQYRLNGAPAVVRPVSALEPIDVRKALGRPSPGAPYGPAAGPGILRMALGAAESLAKFARARFQTVPAETRRRRLQTCAACPHHTGLRCKVCGCFTDIKSRLPHEECPIGKWS
jgi:tetratricopeptide (TPR) repeat protein